jgi:hypothetical protein
MRVAIVGASGFVGTTILSEALIHAYQPPRDSNDAYEQGIAGHRSIIESVRASGITRLLAVGGAVSLKTSQGVEYIDSPLWDKALNPFKKSILCTRALYYMLMEEKQLDWVVVAPSVMLRPGERTTQFRFGHDHLLFDAAGRSRISLQDFAYAMIGELRNQNHH